MEIINIKNINFLIKDEGDNFFGVEEYFFIGFRNLKENNKSQQLKNKTVGAKPFLDIGIILFDELNNIFILDFQF